MISNIDKVSDQHIWKALHEVPRLESQTCNVLAFCILWCFSVIIFAG